MRNFGSWIWTIIEKLVWIVLNLLFKILGKELTEESFKAFMQFVKFGVVGLSNTLISYLIYVISLLIFRKMGILLRSGYLVAQVMAFILSVLWSFYWNNKLVFTLQEGEIGRASCRERVSA